MYTITGVNDGVRETLYREFGYYSVLTRLLQVGVRTEMYMLCELSSITSV
jgi:hypothetical protein